MTIIYFKLNLKKLKISGIKPNISWACQHCSETDPHIKKFFRRCQAVKKNLVVSSLNLLIYWKKTVYQKLK